MAAWRMTPRGPRRGPPPGRRPKASEFRRKRAKRAKRAKEAPWYTLPAGTAVAVRRLGTKPWRPHVTRVTLVIKGHAWRNDGLLGLIQGDFEVKVARHLVGVRE
jgi:hypothetical protein